MLRYLTSILTVLALSASALADGINFRDITFEEALRQAGEEGKLLFVDCYTPTCGPCKFMADKVFPLDECGEYINPRFVSIKKDLVAPENVHIAKQYEVRIYPTFLFLHPDGSVFYIQEGGATRTAEKFLDLMDRIMTIGNSAIEWHNGRRDSRFMINYIKALKSTNEVAMRGVIDLFITSTPADTLAQPDLWDVIAQSLNTADSPAFYDIIGRHTELSHAMGPTRFSTGIKSMLYNDFARCRYQLRDFGSRIATVNALESMGVLPPTALQSIMTIRSIVNNRESDRLNEIIEIVKDVPASRISENEKVTLLNETAAVRAITTPESRRPLAQAVEAAAATLPPAAATLIAPTLSALR